MKSLLITLYISKKHYSEIMNAASHMPQINSISLGHEKTHEKIIMNFVSLSQVLCLINNKSATVQTMAISHDRHTEQPSSCLNICVTGPETIQTQYQISLNLMAVGSQRWPGGVSKGPFPFNRSREKNWIQWIYIIWEYHALLFYTIFTENNQFHNIYLFHEDIFQ